MASIHIDLEIAQESIQKRALLYDKNGDAHYDTISAFIKSVRGSDPDAALYWLAKMLAAGEDPRFILRRLIVLASEDIGLADPQGMQVATSAAYAFEYIGMPEGIYPIVEATLYLATAPKSNSAGAYFKAQRADRRAGHGHRAHPPDGCQPRCARASGTGKATSIRTFPRAFHPPAVPARRNTTGCASTNPPTRATNAEMGERLKEWQQIIAKRAKSKNKGNL